MASGDTLRFKTDRNDSGKYWCLAENGLSSTVSASAFLDVRCKLKMNVLHSYVLNKREMS